MTVLALCLLPYILVDNIFLCLAVVNSVDISVLIDNIVISVVDISDLDDIIVVISVKIDNRVMSVLADSDINISDNSYFYC